MQHNDEYIVNSKHLKVSSSSVGVLVAGLFTVWIVWSVFAGWFNLGDESLGSLFEKNEYSTQYWVYIQPDDVSAKSYRLKGDITKYSSEDGRYYMLDKIYWPNGGNTSFDDCDITKSVQEKNASSCSSGGDNYDIRLGEKVR